MLRYLKTLSTFLVIGTVAIGCKNSNPSANNSAPVAQHQADVNPGWKVVKSAGVAIAFPPTVEAEIMTAESAQALADKAKAMHPGGAKAIDKINSNPSKGGFKIEAKSKAVGPTGFRNNMTLLVLPVKPGTSVDALLKAHTAAIGHLSIPGSVVSKKIELPVGPIGYIESDRQRAGKENRAISTYALPHNSELFLFTFASGQSDKDAWRGTALSVMKTLEFTAATP
jgi:hypothetical protein